MSIRHYISTAIILINLSAASSFLFAADIYVDNVGGDDRANGTQIRMMAEGVGPVRSINRGLSLAHPGDRIVLIPNKNHPYRESITLYGKNNSGLYLEKEYGAPFIIEGNGAVLEGADPLSTHIWEYAGDGLFRFRPIDNPINLRYSQLFLHDELVVRGDGENKIVYDGVPYVFPGVDVELDPETQSLNYVNGRPLERVPLSTRELPELQELQWCVFRGYVYFRPEEGKTPKVLEDYRLSYSARPTGITLLHVSNVRIHDLKIRGFQVDGISAFNNARDIVLDSVFSYANGRSGISIGTAGSVYAGFCGFTGNHESAVYMMRLAREAYFYGCILDGENKNESNLKITIEEAPEGAVAEPATLEPEPEIISQPVPEVVPPAPLGGSGGIVNPFENEKPEPIPLPDIRKDDNEPVPFFFDEPEDDDEPDDSSDLFEFL